MKTLKLRKGILFFFVVVMFVHCVIGGLYIFRNSMKVRFWVSLKIIVITNSTQSQMSLGIIPGFQLLLFWCIRALSDQKPSNDLIGM